MAHLKYGFSMLCAALLIAGCATSKSVSPTQFTGYLGDYSKLEPVKGEGGEELRRWVNPKIKKGQYTKLIVDPVVFHPAPQATKQAAAETLYEIRRYTDEALRRELGKSFLLVNQVGPGVARVRVAITGVTTDAEGMKPYEFFPIAAIVAGAEAASGARARETFLLAEAETLDSVTNERLGMVVRKIPGKRLVKGEKEMLTADMMKPILDDKADNVRRVFDRILK
jgi:hypothetical protein